MQPLDEKQQQRVWSRVLRAQNDACPAGPEDPPQKQDALAELLRAARAAYRRYGQLAGRMRGPAARRMRSLAQQKRQSAKMLAAIRYLKTGAELLPAPDVPEPLGDLRAALRAAYDEERACAAALDRLSAADPELAERYGELARQARVRAQTVLRCLGACL